MNQAIIDLLKAALECSVFINPADPGLSGTELLEVGKRAGYQDGETNDALRHAGAGYFGSKLWNLSPTDLATWVFYFPEEPDLRNFQAFDFVISELNDRVKADGAGRAQLSRTVMVERAVAKGIPRNDVEAAITYQVMAKTLSEKDGVLRFDRNTGVHGLPSQQLQVHGRQPHRKPHRARAFPIVQDLIARRTDGRPRFAEPLDAFADQLDRLQFGKFRLWWTQTVAELKRSDQQSSPLSTSVLAAALVEGALTFVVKHARSLNLEVFRSSDFERDPRTWKIDDLIKSAASGSGAAILDPQARARAETLCRTRQRIHAGRMLSEFPAGVPDLRPDEARDAKATADQVVRCVLDWLEKYPPNQP
ncbi:MAG: hypothetical protein P4M05_33525 [Bradyrhizobium sp.]|nr:hypothetical protein [Bradyrhizobium sp.]